MLVLLNIAMNIHRIYKDFGLFQNKKSRKKEFILLLKGELLTFLGVFVADIPLELH